MRSPTTSAEFRIAVAIPIAVLVLAGGGCRTAGPAAGEEPGIPESRVPLVATVDHFFAVSPDPERLFLLFRDTFGLPEEWPFKRYGDFASGGLSVGNTVLELATWQAPEGETVRTEWKMLAFEPVGKTAAAIAELDRRDVAHSEPDVATYRNAAGEEVVGWTNTGLEGAGLSGIAFLCDYESRESVAEMHRRGAEELRRANGGALGILRLESIEVGVPDLDAARAEWRKLVEPSDEAAADLYRFGAGPAIRLVPAPASGIRGIVLEVASLDRARAFLAERGMLAAASESEVAIEPAALEGLAVRLVGDGGSPLRPRSRETRGVRFQGEGAPRRTEETKR